MKARTLVSLLILVLTILIVIGSCATKRKAISEEDFVTTWSGTWVNTDLKGTEDFEQKIKNYPDGTGEYFSFATDTSIYCKHIDTFSDMEIDSEGNIWFISKTKCIYQGFTWYHTGKISNSGNTLEIIKHYKPLAIEEWDPEDTRYTYRIYYRQE
jgi:hypothetical protein